MASIKKHAAPNPQRLLKKLFIQFQKQMEELEGRGESEPERDTKLLAALVSTLERLTQMESEMKKIRIKKNAKTDDSEAIMRKLAARFEQLVKSATASIAQKPDREGA